MTRESVSAELRDDFVAYLQSAYVGPLDGENEVTTNRPDKTYLVGTLFPSSTTIATAPPPILDDEEAGVSEPDSEDEEPDELLATNSWHPASMAMSFLHNSRHVSCELRAARYIQESEDAKSLWRRVPLEPSVEDIDTQVDSSRPVLNGHGRLTVKTRHFGNVWLTTVALQNSSSILEEEVGQRPDLCLYQVEFACETLDGIVLPYPSADAINMDLEERELELRYRGREAYGVGHGVSVAWERAERVTRISTDSMPKVEVPAVRAREGGSIALELKWLADPGNSSQVLRERLTDFLDSYAAWMDSQQRLASSLGSRYEVAASSILSKMSRALGRMRAGVDLIARDGLERESFRLANAAMREQMLQTAHVARHHGKLGTALTTRRDNDEPRWRPFQLGFLLLTLASTADSGHEDREVVDLIWFPTGGGKTEAYLGLAAFEMIRRRLVSGPNGGGTAVLTRYTLRLLTTQQFQRAASLICALELLRKTSASLARASSFSIGLWLGGETTPNTIKDAHDKFKELRNMKVPENPFQLEACPWCGTRIFPETRSSKDRDYGVRSSNGHFDLFCPHPDCEFNAGLPVLVVDEQIFSSPPSIVMATVDKFARLAWIADAAKILGLSGTHFDPPSLVIQDELHLLSGPLGTTVAIYEAAIRTLLSWSGTAPKIVASTATIRSAGDQVRGLFASEVELYPPSGLSETDSYFAETDTTKPGRLYVGLMPQAHTPSYATVRAIAELLHAPRELELEGPALDAYWTVVAYHNSLRELGRTLTIVRDDVQSLLKSKAVEGSPFRDIKADGVVELTSRVKPSQMPSTLARLEAREGAVDAIDVVATTNMLSVGIDISRLGVMLMNGQPKTTSEYIQATSRVGRKEVPGLVINLLRASRPRDRSHYETFQAYHEAIYRYVEPTSVTPWSLQSRSRSLAGAFVILMRHGAGLSSNDSAADFHADSRVTIRAVRALEAVVRCVDPEEAAAATAELGSLVRDWELWAAEAKANGRKLKYSSSDEDALLKNFGEKGKGWSVMHSMRSVDRQVRILVGDH